MIEVTAVLDDGTVEQYHIDASELVFVRTAEEVANAAADAFIDDVQAVMERHGVVLTGGEYEDWPEFKGAFGYVSLTRWHEAYR